MTPNGWGCKCYTRAVTEARKKRYEEQGIPTAPRLDGTGGGTIPAKTKAPPVKYKTYINERKGTIEQVPEGVDPAFNWHQGKVSRKVPAEHKVQEARNRYTKQAARGMLDQALSAAPGPATPQYEAPILIKRNQQYTRLSLDEAIHRELGYLQGETHKTGKEYMTLMAQGGNRLLGTWSSGKTRTKIFLSDDIRHILENHGEGTLCLLHSHPNNTIFSVGDLAIMNHYESIGNMKLVLSNGKKYSLAIEDGKRLHDEDFAELVEFMDEINDPDKNLFNADKLRRIKEKYNWS